MLTTADISAKTLTGNAGDGGVADVDAVQLAVWGSIAAGVLALTALSYVAYRRRSASAAS